MTGLPGTVDGVAVALAAAAFLGFTVGIVLVAVSAVVNR